MLGNHITLQKHNNTSSKTKPQYSRSTLDLYITMWYNISIVEE
jgi:hypothetical protein